MAKNDKTQASTDDKVMFDGVPGADKKTAEDAEGFKVDMNFEEEPKHQPVENKNTEPMLEKQEENLEINKQEDPPKKKRQKRFDLLQMKMMSTFI